VRWISFSLTCQKVFRQSAAGVRWVRWLRLVLYYCIHRGWLERRRTKGTYSRARARREGERPRSALRLFTQSQSLPMAWPPSLLPTFIVTDTPSPHSGLRFRLSVRLSFLILIFNFPFLVVVVVVTNIYTRTLRRGPNASGTPRSNSSIH